MLTDNLLQATSHKKSVCNGIGGAVNCSTAPSVQRPYNNQILTVIDMMDYCTNNIRFIEKANWLNYGQS